MSGKPAGPAADPAVAVVGSLNMDLVIRVPELPGPGESVSGRAAAACLRQGAQASLPTPSELDPLSEPSRP
jgi:sugar/nucleoside kinase (ribokinase family)